jgi:hypothetical protein
MKAFDYIAGLNSKKLIAIIFILTAISYVNSLGVYFIWDDYSLVVANPNIKTWNIADIFTAGNDIGSGAYKNPLYFRPLQTLSYSLDYKLWKLNPFGYHLSSVALHFLTALLLYFFLLFFFQDKVLSFLGAALFAVNPVFTSTVTYISGRADILAVFFSILMIISFAYSLTHKFNISYYSISVLSFACALLSKEISAVSLIFLFLCDRLMNKSGISRKKVLFYIPYVLVLLAFFYLKPHSLMPGWKVGAHNVFFAVLTLLKALLIYTVLAILPFQLRMGRSIMVVNSVLDVWSFISLAFLIILISLYVFLRKKNKLLITGLIWFYLPLFILALFNIFFAWRGNEMLLPEHNLYFSYIGFLIVLLAFLKYLSQKLNLKKIVTIALLFVILTYSVLTISQNLRWQDEIKFYEGILKYSKNSAFDYMIYANLGYAYERQKKYKQAERCFIRAAELSQGDPYFYNTLAAFYHRLQNQ